MPGGSRRACPLHDLRSGCRRRVEAGHRITESGIDQHSLTRTADELCLGERPERQRLHAPRQRVGEPGRTEQARRPREQKSPRSPLGIDFCLDCEQQVRHPLGLVDADQPTAAADEPDRIRTRDVENCRIIPS